MKIIGHRGATGLALENTIESLKAGINSGISIIEIDIRQTKDQQIVLNHDSDLRRCFGINLSIKNNTLRHLQMICPNLPTLEEALKILSDKTVIIELKGYIKPDNVFKMTKKFPDINIQYASFNHHTIRTIKQLHPESYCFVLEHHSPFEIINKAHKMKADGIGLNYGILNPLTYFLAKRKGLKLYTYTINRLWIAKLVKLFYRNVNICTDFPNKLKDLEL